MNRLTLIAAGIFAAAAAVSAAAATGPEEAAASPAPPILSTEISGSDLGFFTGAAREMALLAGISELAKSHAVTPEVRELAAAEWKEQTQAVARLDQLAQRKHVPLPQEPDGEGRKLLQSLARQKGAKLDKSCLDAMGDAQDLLETSLDAGAASTDAEIKAFAQAGLETLKQERERVRKLGM